MIIKDGQLWDSPGVLAGPARTQAARDLGLLPEEPCPLSIAEKIDLAVAEIDVAWKSLNPIMLVGAFSGGNDSLSACYVASRHPAFAGILHINTGIGVEETRKFVRQTCREQGWKLWEYKASENVTAKGNPDPMVYADLVAKHGFPGPGGHQLMYTRLKERQLRRFERDMGATARGKNKKRIMMVSGTRIDESARRKMNVNPELVQVIEGRRIWVSPVRDWSKADLRHCRMYAGLRENRVSQDIHKSGECLCGAFAKPGELEELRMFYPNTAAEIDRIAEIARANGKHAIWGTRPPKCPKKEKIGGGHMCTQCVLNFHEITTTVTTLP